MTYANRLTMPFLVEQDLYVPPKLAKWPTRRGNG